MRVLHGIGGTLLWALAALGVLSGVAWGANALGLLYPLIVVSGSMSPGIQTGDLVVAVPRAIEDVAAGDVVTLPSTVSQKLVTHRVVSVEPVAGGFEVTMKGDANDTPDPEVYRVADGRSVPTPWFVVPAGGRIIETVSRPVVAVPLLIALVGLIGLAALPPAREERETDAHEEDPDVDDDDDEPAPAAESGSPSQAVTS